VCQNLGQPKWAYKKICLMESHQFVETKINLFLGQYYPFPHH
jgi:hypothetical protein